MFEDAHSLAAGAIVFICLVAVVSVVLEHLAGDGE
jgi:hypothetical protein